MYSRIEYFRLEDIAHKTLHVNLSDIAAMAAKPLYILCGISVPLHLHDYVAKFLERLTLVCKKLEIILIGGDTTATTDKFFISITAIGLGQKNHIKYRNSSKNGDANLYNWQHRFCSCFLYSKKTP